MTNLNDLDTKLAIEIPENILDHLYLGQSREFESGSKSNYNHGGSITNFNMWNKALSKKEMIDWTQCRYKRTQEPCEHGVSGVS